MGFFSTKRKTSESAVKSSFAPTAESTSRSSDGPLLPPSATLSKSSGATHVPSPLTQSPLEASFSFDQQQQTATKASRFGLFNSVKSVRPAKKERSKTMPNVQSIKYSPPSVEERDQHQQHFPPSLPAEEPFNIAVAAEQYAKEPEEVSRASIDTTGSITAGAFRLAQSQAAKSSTSLHSLDADSRSSSLLDLRLPPTARTPNATQRPSFSRPLSMDPEAFSSSRFSSYSNMAPLATSSLPPSPKMGYFPTSPTYKPEFATSRNSLMFEPPKPAFLSSHISRSPSAASLTPSNNENEPGSPPRMENRRSVSESFKSFADPLLITERKSSLSSPKRQSKKFSLASNTSSTGRPSFSDEEEPGGNHDASVVLTDDEEDGETRPSIALQPPSPTKRDSYQTRQQASHPAIIGEQAKESRHGWESEEAERRREAARAQVAAFMARPSSPFAQSSFKFS